MKKSYFAAAAIASILASGCAQPIREAYPSMTPYDAETVYSIEPREGGFTLSAVFAQHQFKPDMSALITMCKSRLGNIALDHADKQRKKTKPLDDQRIKLSTDRNIMNGISTCKASVPVEWK